MLIYIRDYVYNWLMQQSYEPMYEPDTVREAKREDSHSKQICESVNLHCKQICLP